MDLRDVIYFLSLAGVFLALAYGALLGRKLAPATGGAPAQLGVGMLAASLVGGEPAGQLHRRPARPDAGEAYTFSPATRSRSPGTWTIW